MTSVIASSPKPINNNTDNCTLNGDRKMVVDQLASVVSDNGCTNCDIVSPLLQEVLGVNDKGKCIRHSNSPVLLFTKDSRAGTGGTTAGIYKIVPCRVCYAEEKSCGIHQGVNSFSAVVTQLRSIAAHPLTSSSSHEEGDKSTDKGELYNLHNSLSNLDFEANSDEGGGGSNNSNGVLSTAHNTTVVMESIMKRLSQVHNWTIRQKDKEIKSLQMHINSLEQQLAAEQEATNEQRSVVKALRRTIQQDLKIIKTMATQKQLEDDAAAHIAQAEKDGGPASEPGSPLKSAGTGSPGKIQKEIEVVDKDQGTDFPSAPISYFSPSKACSAEENATQPRRKEHPNALRSMTKQARRLERMQSSRSIEEPIIEIHGAEDSENSDKAGTDIIFTAETPDEDVEDDDSDDENKMFSGGSYWNDNDMRGLKASKIFQSFRGGLLDIPKSPPKHRHDLDDEDESGKKNKNRRKKLTLNTSDMDALKMPARGVISRSSSGDETFGLMALKEAMMQQQQQQAVATPKTPLMMPFGGPLDTPTTGEESGGNANSNTKATNACGLESLTMKLQSLPLSAQSGASKTPEHEETKVQQHPNMPAMSPLEAPANTPVAPEPPGKLSLLPPKAESGTTSKADDSTAVTTPSFFDCTIEDPTAAAKSNNSSNELTENSSPTQTESSTKATVGKDKKLVFAVTNATAQDKFGDEGIYSGDILVTEGLPHGKGKMKYESGRIYDGDWICGQWHGQGKLLNPNGDTYIGEFFFDSRHGQGIYKWDNGDVYEGSFLSDKRHGKGKFSFHNGNVYTGEFCDGMFEGYGRYEFDGGYYVGEWKAGRYDGSGELVNAEGGKYTGEFRNSVAHGFGTEVTADGRVRRGMWTLGKPSEGFDK